MLVNILVATALLVVTCGIHIAGMILVMDRLHNQRPLFRNFPRLKRASQVAEVVLIMFFASLLEVLLWAIAYMALGEIENLEPAFYFSMVTFTTLGYGDIVLDESWRLLASFEAGTGIIMFGWTTALVLAAVQSIYFGKNFNKPTSQIDSNPDSN